MNARPNKYKYSCYDFKLVAHSQFSWSNSEWGWNVLNFAVDNNSSVHVHNWKNIFSFLVRWHKENFFIGLSTCTIGRFGESLASNSICLNKQSCQARPTIVNITTNQPLHYPFTVNVNKCGGSCNTIYDPNAQVWIPNKVKNLNNEIFNLTSGINEWRVLNQHEFRV